MKREILFRGITVESGCWVYGFLQIRKKSNNSSLEYHICNLDGQCDLVKQDSVGQFIGQKDKEGVDVYEGDLIYFGNPDRKYEIYWSQHHNAWRKRTQNGTSTTVDEFVADDWTIVGNVHSSAQTDNS